MRNLLLIFIVSLSIAQMPIETREYRFYKEQNINEINLFDLIQESEGLFKVELIAAIYLIKRFPLNMLF